MASNRHLGRIIALQTLYEQSYRLEAKDKSYNLDEVLDRNIKRYHDTVGDVAFVLQLVHGITEHLKELDNQLRPIAPERPIEQIARIDHIVLQIGAYELEHSVGVPPKVVINEAVELAKAFGSEKSSKFINGVMGTLLRMKMGESVNIESSLAKEKRKEAAKTKKDETDIE